MKSPTARLPSPAMVVALVALVVATAGTTHRRHHLWSLSGEDIDLTKS